MKLVDILARELVEWPSNQPCLWISDSHSATVYGRSGSHEVSFTGDWPCPDDYLTAIVYKADWQSAVDALKVESAPAWVGVGAPPVGTVCEFHGSSAACPDDPWHPDLKDGDHVTIIAYFSDSFGQIAAFTFKARNENIAAIQVEQARPGAFRPIRTPEQIAAEKGSKQLDSDLAMYGTSFALTNDDGSITRLDPTKIVMRKQGAK